MTTDISNTDDIIDVRDIIARVDELTPIDDDQALSEEDKLELIALENLLEALKGNGADEEWKGDWYPVTLIRDSYFETAMDELIDDIGEMPKNIPSYLKITVDYDALQMDYTPVEYDGVTYWYR